MTHLQCCAGAWYRTCSKDIEAILKDTDTILFSFSAIIEYEILWERAITDQ
jgi:hypothetical protein